MKIKNYLQIKKNKPFEINDIFIYSALIVSLFVLFICFVILPQKQQSNGFQVYKNQELVFTFYFAQNNISIEDNYLNLVEIEQVQNGFNLKVYTDETHTGFNLIFINTIERYAKMQDSTCSHSKDCVHSPSITNSGIIYCAPHGLKITQLGTNDIPPWTGGA